MTTVTRIPEHAIVVMRAGKRVKAKSGVAFEFTADEVAELGDKTRAPKNESGGMPANAVSKDVANKFTKLVKAAEDAAAKSKAKATDKKLADAAKAAKDAVVEYAAATGLDVPESLDEDI